MKSRVIQNNELENRQKLKLNGNFSFLSNQKTDAKQKQLYLNPKSVLIENLSIET